MRRLSVLMVALLAVLGAAVAVAGVAVAGVAVPRVAAAAASCATPWTSGVDTAPALNPSPLVAVQTGSHACYDRVVFRIAGSVGAGWDVRYVDVVRTDGSGTALAVPGGARLEVRLHHPAYDERGTATFTAPVGGRVTDPAGYPTLRSVIYGGSYEGYTLLGVGTRARLPFRVFSVAGPGSDTRIVLDIAHQW